MKPTFDTVAQANWQHSWVHRQLEDNQRGAKKYIKKKNRVKERP